jgi:uncharacterized protein
VSDPTAYAPWLWLATILLTGRVLAQVLVVVFAPRWLPPQGEQWMSGLVPYRWLLPGQIATLSLMSAISLDFTRGAGRFVDPSPRAGRVILVLSAIYATWMIVRYIVRMTRRPDQRWFGGTIPIIFHTIIALFLAIVAMWHVG